MLQKEYTNFKLSTNLIFDFHKLACLEPALRPYVLILNNRTVCNFKDQQCLIALNKAIMKFCFNYDWNCPEANLCPRIPGRLNYLLWIRLNLKDESIRTVLDIGTGATLVYPLLGVKCFGWKFIASEINSFSFRHSQNLVAINCLQQSIDLRLVQLQQSLSEEQMLYKDPNIMKDVVRHADAVDVVICNPPFFEEDRQTLTNMVDSQHHVTGGEYSFFFTLYRESFGLKNVRYCSCLIGLLKNFKEIKQFLIDQAESGYLSFLKFGQIQQGNNLRYLVMWKLKD